MTNQEIAERLARLIAELLAAQGLNLTTPLSELYERGLDVRISLSPRGASISVTAEFIGMPYPPLVAGRKT